MVKKEICENNIESIVIPDKKEMQEFFARMREMEKKIFALTDEERNHACDMGFYNDTIRGYMIYAMQAMDFTREDIEKALRGMYRALDDISAKKASEIYIEF